MTIDNENKTTEENTPVENEQESTSETEVKSEEGKSEDKTTDPFAGFDSFETHDGDRIEEGDTEDGKASSESHTEVENETEVEVDKDQLPKDGQGDRQPGSEGEVETEPEVEGEGEAKTEDKEEGDKKEPHKVEERIGKLVKDGHAKDRDLSESKRDAEYWKNKALQDGKVEGEGEKVEAKPAPEEDLRPKSEDFDGGELDPKFIEALSRFSARDENRKIEAENAEAKRVADTRAAVDQVNKTWDENISKGAAKYNDFEEKVINGAGTGSGGAWACSQIMGATIKTSEVGHELAYQLASNPEESQRIADMQPLDQVKELGRLETKFLSDDVTIRKGETKPKTSKAPTPPKHRATGGSGIHNVPADTDDFSKFESEHKGRVR